MPSDRTPMKFIRSIYDALKSYQTCDKRIGWIRFFMRRGNHIKAGRDSEDFQQEFRAKMEENWVLQCYPRSGLGFKFRLQLNNTVGIIDSDYYNSDNEDTFLQRSRMTQKKEKQWKSRQEQDLCRGFSWNMGLRLMMMWKKSVTADLAARRNNREEKNSIFA